MSKNKYLTLAKGNYLLECDRPYVEVEATGRMASVDKLAKHDLIEVRPVDGAAGTQFWVKRAELHEIKEK